MVSSYERRAGVLDAAIRRGDIGCRFGKEAAERGLVRYCPAPGIDSGKEKEMFVEGVRSCARDACCRVLVIVPDTDARSIDTGREQALGIYEETLAALADVNRGILADLERNQELDAVRAIARGENPPGELNMDAIAGLVPEAGCTREQIRSLMATPLIRDQVCGHFLKGNNAYSLHTLNVEQCRAADFVAFAMGPQYAPLKPPVPHPRYAPHSCVLLTHDDDIQDMYRSRPDAIEAMKRWQVAAVGYDFVHCYYMDQQPRPRVACSYHPD